MSCEAKAAILRATGGITVFPMESQMADITTNTVAATSGFSFSKAFDNAVDWLVNLSKNSSRAKAVDALSAMSDEELAAKGTTRKDEVMRIFGASAYI